MNMFFYVLTGVCAGTLAGFFGLGGGIAIVPILVYFWGHTQHEANGTSVVALLSPVGIMGVVTYYQAGKIDSSNVKAGLLIALGMFIGAWLGSQGALLISDGVLRKCFAVFLVLVAAKMWFQG